MKTASQTIQPQVNLSISDKAPGPQPSEMPAPQPTPVAAGVARQSDLVELNRRISEKLAKLPQAVLAQGASARSEAMARIDTLESRIDSLGKTLDGLEGALRIELAPFLSAAVTEAVREQTPKRLRHNRFGLGLAALVVGVAAGVIFHDQFLEGVDFLRDALAARLP